MPTHDCPNQEERKATCTCTYTSCQTRGLCCDCIESHLKKKQLPGCCFPPAAEATYDRSFQAFAKAWNL
jgi:hypothetical protein